MDGWVVLYYQHCEMLRLYIVCVCVCLLCIPIKVHNCCISQHQPFTTLPPPTFISNLQPVLQISQSVHWGPINNPSGTPPTLSSHQPYHPYLYNICHLPAWLLFLDCLTVKTKELWSFKKSGIIYPTKGKAIPLQAWTGPEGSRRLRLPDFKTVGTWRW